MDSPDIGPSPIANGRAVANKWYRYPTLVEDSAADAPTILSFDAPRLVEAENRGRELGGDILGTVANVATTAVKPYVDFYQKCIVQPFWQGVDVLAKSPVGDPGLYASLQGLGPAGAVAAGVGAVAAKGLRAVVAIALPQGPAAKGGLTAAEQFAINRAAGAAMERTMGANLDARGIENGPQVAMRTENGLQTRMDFVTRDPQSGTIGCIECKASQTAPIKPNQRLAHAEIARSGAIIVGAGKPGFPGGTKIPPTEVQIVRGPVKDAP